jgi:hypothetical protein
MTQQNLEPTPKPTTPMTSKPTPKPILRPKPHHQEEPPMTQFSSIKGQLDKLEQLRNDLLEREKALEERARELVQRLEQCLSQKTKELDEREEALDRLEQLLGNERPTSEDEATPNLLSPTALTPTPTSKQSAPNTSSTTSSSTTSSATKRPTNSVLFAFRPVTEIMPLVPVPMFTPKIPKPFNALSFVPSTLPSSTAHQPAFSEVAAITSPRAQQVQVSFRKSPLAWIAQHKGAIGGVIVSGLVGFSTAYASRALVANEIAKQTTTLQKEAIHLQAASLDPFRKLRDELLEQDPCRSGHAYLLISNTYETFARQSPAHQLKILGLDPKIRTNINLIAQGQAPRSGACNLFR